MTLSRLLLSVIAVLTLASGAVQTAAANEAGDAALAQAVKAKLAAKDPDFFQAGQVEVSDGVVTLKGAVLTNATLLKALQQAGSVPGVQKVINHVSMRQ
jgi:osmotically-inducible protein OsmY